MKTYRASLWRPKHPRSIIFFSQTACFFKANLSGANEINKVIDI
jgi:hypothetical protein